MKIFNAISSIWSKFLAVFHEIFEICTIYKSVLFVIGLLAPKKVYPETEVQTNYAVLICARNEKAVIGNLIDSIHRQTYNKDKLTVFVVADNCDDNTAEIAREKGCVVYERFDKTRARKGWAMEFFFEQIQRDYGISTFDGYVVFDADNLLHPTFMEELNKAFVDTDESIVVGYRNTKNFDRNFISAGYGIHFMRSVVSYHRPRGMLNYSTHIAGTGYVIPSRLLKDGWHYTCLTEDTQFTLNSVADGEFIAFCEDAEFFDEQPYQVKVMARQRMRWTKGRLYSFLTTAHRLVKGIFTRGGMKSFACYDMFFYAFPNSVYHALRELAFPVIGFAIHFLVALVVGDAIGVAGTARAAGADPLTALAIFAAIATPLAKLASTWFKNALKGALVVIRERKKIHCSTPKLVFYTILFPWFDLIGGPLALCSLFSTTQWKPIKHDEDISIDQLTQNGGDNV